MWVRKPSATGAAFIPVVARRRQGDSELFDVSNLVRIEGVDRLCLPFDIDEVIENLRREACERVLGTQS